MVQFVKLKISIQMTQSVTTTCICIRQSHSCTRNVDGNIPVITRVIGQRLEICTLVRRCQMFYHLADYVIHGKRYVGYVCYLMSHTSWAVIVLRILTTKKWEIFFTKSNRMTEISPFQTPIICSESMNTSFPTNASILHWLFNHKALFVLFYNRKAFVSNRIPFTLISDLA